MFIANTVVYCTRNYTISKIGFILVILPIYIIVVPVKSESTPSRGAGVKAQYTLHVWDSQEVSHNPSLQCNGKWTTLIKIVHNDTFDIKGNILHYSSTECKRVTRSVSASDIYGMISSFDLGSALITTLKAVTKSLSIKSIPLIIYTDSFSLYQCLTKQGILIEKRIMIDVMSLRQSYERREIEEFRWINGADNPADAMNKSSPNKALTNSIDSNTLSIRIDGSVDRPSFSDEST
ncbi:hypothetical protein EV44_g3648 [Erysiphe necator]|uniref:Uncharacterized protein n=1 Tax=Uncinula necator TaxID=52586 RepID=A0A0B1P686_UNCNE|nr:hypothetical protein EV44_g3648 [Erysiphe necator]